MPSRSVRRTRLAVVPLEDRAVPAFNLTIDGDVAASFNIAVDTTTLFGTTIFSPSGSGAVLDVDAVETALASSHVLITTGPGGSEAGNITYTRTGDADDLSYFGAGPRTLAVRPAGPAAGGNVAVTGVAFLFADNVDLAIDTTGSATDGGINLADVLVVSARGVTLNAGDGRVDLRGLVDAGDGDVVVTAGTFAPGPGAGATLTSAVGAVTLDATIALDGNPLTVRADNQPVSLNGPVFGPGDLTVYGPTVAVNGPVGQFFPVTNLTFGSGAVTYGANTVSAGTLRIGDGFPDPDEATFGAGTGTVAANVVVLADGNLAPGGVGTPGTLTLVGTLTFQGGDLSLDLEPQPDRVAVSGDVTITAGRLGNEQSTGALPAGANVPVIDFTGTLTGTFSNAPLGSGFYLAGDPVRVTSYDTDPVNPGGSLTLAPVPVAPGGVATGFEPDGTQYTFRLTGGGELVTFRDTNLPPNQQLNVYVRNTTFLSRVTLTTKANGSDTLVDLGPVRVAGPLGGFSAAPANLNAPFVADQPVKALTLGRIDAPVTLAAAATDKTTLTARSVGASVTTPGVLSAVTVTGDLVGTLSALSIGTVKVGGQLTGVGPGWVIPNGVKAITAGRIESFNLTAVYLGTLTATGNATLSGDVSNSTFRLTGNDGTAARFGLKTLVAKGNVRNTRFDVEEGHVGAVTVGRFIDSHLYVDYTPGGAFNTGGAFNSTTKFRVGTFTTTALPLNDTTSALNYSFAGSQVAADTLVKVRLSGLETGNGGSAFGFKFQTAGGSVQVKAADHPGIIPGFNLTPSASPLAGDFFYLDV